MERPKEAAANYGKVMAYRQKLYINEIPKTSPNSRNGIEEVYYKIAHGKQALLEKREQIRMQNNVETKIEKPAIQPPVISKVGHNDATPNVNYNAAINSQRPDTRETPSNNNPVAGRYQNYNPRYPDSDRRGNYPSLQY